MSRRYVTVEAEVDIADVISELTDKELELYGLQRISAPSEIRRELYYAMQFHPEMAPLIVERMAWEVDGKVLVLQ